MNIFQKSDEFDAWLIGLKDPVGKAQIFLRLDRAAKGNFGDCEPVGAGASEMRIHYGPRLPGVFHPARRCNLSAAVGRRQINPKT